MIKKQIKYDKIEKAPFLEWKHSDGSYVQVYGEKKIEAYKQGVLFINSAKIRKAFEPESEDGQYHVGVGGKDDNAHENDEGKFVFFLQPMTYSTTDSASPSRPRKIEEEIGQLTFRYDHTTDSYVNVSYERMISLHKTTQNELTLNLEDIAFYQQLLDIPGRLRPATITIDDDFYVKFKAEIFYDARNLDRYPLQNAHHDIRAMEQCIAEFYNLPVKEYIGPLPKPPRKST